MRKIEALEHAKRKAAASYARMCTQQQQPQQQQEDVEAMQLATTRDEQDVLRARVDVLNTLMRAPDVRLCLESDNDTNVNNNKRRVCVTYDRMRCSEGELELGPMQSTMSWAVRGGEDPILHLLSAGDGGAHAPVVKGLLELIRQSAPKKDTLQRLHEVLSLPAPERLVLKSVVGLNAAREDHTRVIEGLGESTTAPVPPLYRITWGALDLDVLEGWQNPSTNAAIRRSILDTAHQAVREAERTKAPAWSNVSYMQVRIFHADECHVLSLRPFRDSESCTVSHLQYRQSVFDDDVSGPERGILNLTQKDPADIHAIPMGTILPLQAYVCLGAHRKSRLNEAQLNYVHAQGLLAHPGLDVKLLPDAASLLLQQQTRTMIPAKSTRISADKLDVVASSYHVADQVYTTISVVQYPPFGTQFESKQEQTRKKQEKQTSRSPAQLKATHEALRLLNATEGGSDDEFDEDFDVEIDDETAETPKIAGHTREPLRAGEVPSYKLGREYLPPFDEEGNRRGRRNNWKIDLRDGEHYFIDGIHANPKEIDPRNASKRFIWFELDKGSRYKQAENTFNEIKEYIRDQKIPWNSAHCFYWNLERNQNTGKDGLTAGQIWYSKWKPLIFLHAYLSLEAAADKTYNHFWYVHDDAIWDDIFREKSLESGINYAEHYRFHQRKCMAIARSNGVLSKCMNILPPQVVSSLLPSHTQIPLPPRNQPMSARNNKLPQQAPVDPALSKLKTRIDALETKLSQVRQEENTKHLLHMVLDRLDTLEEITEV